jgi:hypothetical protein
MLRFMALKTGKRMRNGPYLQRRTGGYNQEMTGMNPCMYIGFPSLARFPVSARFVGRRLTIKQARRSSAVAAYLGRYVGRYIRVGVGTDWPAYLAVQLPTIARYLGQVLPLSTAGAQAPLNTPVGHPDSSAGLFGVLRNARVLARLVLVTDSHTLPPGTLRV